VAGRRWPSRNLASILQRRCVRALTLYRSEGYLCWGRVTLAATSSKIARLSNKPRARLEKGLCGAIFKARVTRRYERGIVTDHLAEKLIQFPNQGMIRVAQGIFRRPVLAGGVYLLALLGVLSSPFGRSRPAPHVVHYEAEGEPSAVGALGSPDASVLREIEGAGLRVIERAFEPG